MDEAEEQLPVHDSSADHDHLGRNQQRDVQAQLRKVKSHQSPHIRIVCNFLKSGEVDFEPFCDGLVADHSLQAGLLLVERTNSSEMLVLVLRSFHSE